MPFLRFSRDKRGYENTYLVQATNRRGKPVRPRILYWYRTPPGVRLGRVPFDAEVRKALEAQNPGILFDWTALANTSFPAQEPEFWRERRRAEKAAKQARREEEATEPGESEDQEPSGDENGGDERRLAPPDSSAADPPEPADVSESTGELELSASPVDQIAAVPETDVVGPDANTPAVQSAPGAERTGKRRRRRGGRRRREGSERAGAPSETAVPASEHHDDSASDDTE